jgi:hypothetical protein
MRRVSLILFLLTSFAFARQYPAAGGNFTFPTVENPLSNSGDWISASPSAVGTHYGACAVAVSGRLTSTQITDSGFTDCTVILAGPWGPNQTVHATVNYTNGIEENEIRLRTFYGAAGSNAIFGYELNCTQNYVEIVRWDGFSGGAVQFQLLIHDVTNHCNNGETETATVNSAGLFTLTTATKSTTATDTTYTTGAPGLGLNTFTSSGGVNSDHWYSSFNATDGLSTQLWSNQIDPFRAIPWTAAGINQAGTLPSSTWTRCGSVITAFSGAATAINNAIVSCGNQQYVELGAGTFNLTSGINIAGKNNVAVRGQGPNSTKLVFSGAGAGHYNSVVAMEPSALNESNGSEQNVCDFTSGYAQGSTTISLSNCGATTPAKGAIGNLKVGSIIMLDQLDEGADNGTIWNCLAGVSEGGAQCANNPVGSAGEARHNGTCNASPTMCYRSQEQGVIVTSCDGVSTAGHVCASGTNIGISPGLYMPNWSSAQKPQAWYATSPISNNGLENLSIDATSAGSGQTILVGNCNGCWVSGVKSTFANRSHIRELFSTHYQFQYNYFYNNISHATVSYGVEMFGGWDGLIINNIFQQSTDSEPSCSGSCQGNVIALNFDVNNVYGTPGWMQAGNYLHSSGTAFNLWEMNIGPGYNADDVHGTHAFDTVFRNRLEGNQNAGCGGPGVNTCTAQTTPVILQAGARYFNIIGNVLGRSGFHTNYWCNATSTASCATVQTSIFSTGFTGNGGQQQSAVNGFCSTPACLARGAFDPQVGTYLFRWGNWDTSHGSAQFSNSEVPTSSATFPNAIPATQTLPPSYYFASTPAFWASGKPWPPIGPDVTGGNMGKCSGGTYANANALTSAQCTGGSLVTDLGGHVYSTPAMDCFLSQMGGPPDGTGSALTFPGISCFGAGSTSPTFFANTSLVTFGATNVGQTLGPNSITISNTGSANLSITAVNVTGDFSFSLGSISPNCGPVPITIIPTGSCTLVVSFTPTAAGARSGNLSFTDNAAGSPHVIGLSGTGNTPPGPVSALFAKAF